MLQKMCGTLLFEPRDVARLLAATFAVYNLDYSSERIVLNYGESFTGTYELLRQELSSSDYRPRHMAWLRPVATRVLVIGELP